MNIILHYIIWESRANNVKYSHQTSDASYKLCTVCHVTNFMQLILLFFISDKCEFATQQTEKLVNWNIAQLRVNDNILLQKEQVLKWNITLLYKYNKLNLRLPSIENNLFQAYYT